jgi:putative PIN family toxin of toxin-antitoxin system
VRVVLDSSVLIAASISRAGVCAELFEDVLTHHELIISDFIVEEVQRKLRDKFRFPPREIGQLRRLLGRVAISVTPRALPGNVCRDPNDIPVLGTAVASSASLLVSVDKDLLAVGEFQGTVISRPADFWRVTTG